MNCTYFARMWNNGFLDAVERNEMKNDSGVKSNTHKCVYLHAKEEYNYFFRFLTISSRIHQVPTQTRALLDIRA
jgi:hypothetical protein